MKKLLITLFVLSSLSLARAEAQRPLQDRIAALHSAFITEKLRLTPVESQNFWPIYNELREKERALKESYQPGKDILDMSEAEATTFINNYFQAESELLQMRREYYNRLKDVIPVRKIAMLNRVERQFKEMLLEEIQKRRAKRRARPGGGYGN